MSEWQGGMMEAVRILRKGAQEYEDASKQSRKVLDIQVNELAASLLRSWANGIEIDASKPEFLYRG